MAWRSSLSSNFRSQITGLQTQVEDVDKRARRGIAAAAAISSIPVVLNPGRTSLTLGSGFYRDAGAVSVSFTHRLNTTVPIYLQGGTRTAAAARVSAAPPRPSCGEEHDKCHTSFRQPKLRPRVGAVRFASASYGRRLMSST